MESMTSGRIIARFLLCLCLTSCARLPSPPEDIVTRANIDLTHWRCIGRVGIKQQGQGGTAHFNWLQSESKYQIDFTGPIGVGHARLVGEEGEVTLYVDNKNQGTAESSEALASRFLGNQLPLSGLVFWIRGIPDPSEPWQQFSDFEFIQQGWRILVVDTQNVEGYSLPRKLRLNRDEMRITLVVSEWLF